MMHKLNVIMVAAIFFEAGDERNTEKH